MATSVVVPLAFVPTFADAFALPKLATLYVLVPWAAAGPIAFAVLVPPADLPHPRSADLAALAFALLALLSTALAANPGRSLQGQPLQYQGLLPLLLYVASYFLARLAIRGEESRRALFVGVTLAGGIVASYALLQQAGLDPIWHTLDKGRVFSTLGQADDLAAYLVLAAPAALALALDGGRLSARTAPLAGTDVAAWRRLASRPVRLLCGLALALMLVALILTLSRGGYLGLAAEVLVAGALLGPRLRPSRGLIGRSVLAILLVAAVVIAMPPVRRATAVAIERAASIGNLSGSSIQDHLDLWAVGARITLDHPLVGTGPDSYVLTFPAYRDTTLPVARAAFLARFTPESPHDVYLAVSSGIGLPALACYLLLIAAALAGLWRALRNEPEGPRFLTAALAAAILGHLVTDGFMTAELAGSWLFWTYLGAAASLTAKAQRRDT